MFQNSGENLAENELSPRRITVPRRYSHYQQLFSSEDDEMPTDSKSSLLNRQRKPPKNKSGTLINDDDAIISSNVSQTAKDKNVICEENKKYGVNAFVCSECGKVLRSESTLQRHKISHSGLKPFQCEVCNQGFSSSVSLREHKARHEGKMLYECSTCNKQFRQNSVYHRHLAIHLKSAVHVCEICEHQFIRKDYLRAHMKSHIGEKRYECKQCPKSFVRVSDLKRHKIIHSGERPYQCDVCGMSFADSSSCRRHVKDHDNNDKPPNHPCPHCNSLFRKTSLLSQHISKNHRERIIKSSAIKSSSVPLSFEDASTSRKEIEVQNRAEPGDTLGRPPSAIDCVNDMPTENFLPVETLTYTVFKEVVNDVESSIYENIMDKLCLDIPKTQLAFSDANVDLHPDYVSFPDFSSQEYYTWLSNFNEMCKVLPFPLETELFNKISQVHKSITDVLAEPIGLLNSRNNFQILRSISNDLNNVINSHLDFIYGHLAD